MLWVQVEAVTKKDAFKAMFRKKLWIQMGKNKTKKGSWKPREETGIGKDWDENKSIPPVSQHLDDYSAQARPWLRGGRVKKEVRVADEGLWVLPPGPGAVREGFPDNLSSWTENWKTKTLISTDKEETSPVQWPKLSRARELVEKQVNKRDQNLVPKMGR